MNYKLKENAGATGLRPGNVYTEKEINDLPGMGGVDRLLKNGAIEVTDERATSDNPDQDDPRAAHNNTGSPPPLSKEEGKEDEARVQRAGGQIGDAAEKANPPSGSKGTVAKVSKDDKKSDAR